MMKWFRKFFARSDEYERGRKNAKAALARGECRDDLHRAWLMQAIGDEYDQGYLKGLGE